MRRALAMHDRNRVFADMPFVLPSLTVRHARRMRYAFPLRTTASASRIAFAFARL
jgi:hypothetical protein